MTTKLLAIVFCTLALTIQNSVVYAAPRGNYERVITQQARRQMLTDLPDAKFYEEGVQTTRVYGQTLAHGTTAIDAAEQFRLRHTRVFGINPEELKIAGLQRGAPIEQPMMYDAQSDTYKFTLIRYAHYKNGVPVFRSDMRLLVRNTVGSPVVMVSGQLRPLNGFVPDPIVSKQRVDPATMGTGMSRFDKPETVIWTGVETAQSPRLAHVFVGSNGSINDVNFEKWLYVTDASTGETLYRENRIIMTDVAGNVSGLATQGPKADFCSSAVQTPMPWALASITGGDSVFTDNQGNFVITNSSMSDVTVESPLEGHYFNVTNFSGSEDLLAQNVTPPGPVTFVHHASDIDDLVRSQINGYIEANLVRDFALSFNPSFPVISTQTDFPVLVNVLSPLICPGNAWYDYKSINFCRTGDRFPSSAFSVIIHHEYGHHIVASAGSGQGAYGEGFGDTMGVLIEDDPVFAYGWRGDCNIGVRTADNAIQYPCDGGIHHCGQLLSGSVWSIRNELKVTNPSTYLDILSNLTVNSVLLHRGKDITPSIAIDFLTLDDDDGDIGNGTPHRNEICAGFAAHNMDCPALVPCDVPTDCSDADGLFCGGPEDRCNDGNACTEDLCDEATDTCSHPTLICPPPADSCNTAFCHPRLGCLYNPCDDGEFCNGNEICINGDCLAGTPPCEAVCCNETNDICLDSQQDSRLLKERFGARRLHAIQDNPCSRPVGACCFSSTCKIMEENQCDRINGTYHGDNVSCSGPGLSLICDQ